MGKIFHTIRKAPSTFRNLRYYSVLYSGMYKQDSKQWLPTSPNYSNLDTK